MKSKCGCFLIYFLLHHPYIGMLQRLRPIENGAAVASPLDVAWLSGDPVQGPELTDNELWGLPDELQPAASRQSRGSLGSWGPGVAGDARPERAALRQLRCTAPLASPGTGAQAQFDGLEANRESLQPPVFLDGEYSMFVRGRCQPSFQGQRALGERGQRGTGGLRWLLRARGREPILHVNNTSQEQKLLTNSGQNAGRISPGSQARRLFPAENRPR